MCVNPAHRSCLSLWPVVSGRTACPACPGRRSPQAGGCRRWVFRGGTGRFLSPGGRRSWQLILQPPCCRLALSEPLSAALNNQNTDFVWDLLQVCASACILSVLCQERVSFCCRLVLLKNLICCPGQQEYRLCRWFATSVCLRVYFKSAVQQREIVKRCKLKWYAHVSRSSCLAKTILQSTVKGGRRQGRQRKRWEDNIEEWTGLEFTKSQRAVENRKKRKKKWRKLVVKSSVVPQWRLQLRDRWRWSCNKCLPPCCWLTLFKPASVALDNKNVDYACDLLQVYASLLHDSPVQASICCFEQKTPLWFITNVRLPVVG